MKTVKLLTSTFALAFFAVKCEAQITLDNTYTSAKNSLYIVELEQSGPKYVKLSRTAGNRQITLYNMNHTIWKTINCNPFPRYYNVDTIISLSTTPTYTYVTNYCDDFDALYISEKLFNTDATLEFMFVTHSPNKDHWYTGVYTETGTALFQGDSMNPYIITGEGQYSNKAIYTTAVGTKMILSHQDGSANVYTISGTTTAYNINSNLRTLNNPTNDFNNGAISAFPNPLLEYSIIRYDLPAGVTEGKIAVYDMSGRMIKEFKVDNSFREIYLSANDIPAGQYYVTLETQSGKVSKGLIKINN